MIRELLAATSKEEVKGMNWGNFQPVDSDGFEYGPLNTVGVARAFVEKDFATAYALMAISLMNKFKLKE